MPFFWIFAGILTLCYVAWRGAGNAGTDDVLIGAGIGLGSGIFMVALMVTALRRAVASKGDSLQKYLVVSMSLKMGVAVVLGAFLVATGSGTKEQLADAETALLSYMALVFFGFAWQGFLLEGRGGGAGSESDQSRSKSD